MNQKINGTPAPGITLDDILFILFRHKWKITVLSVLAIAAAGGVYVFWPLPYRSEARLLIKYVVDTKNPGQMGASNSKVTSPDDRGETVVNTELEVLGSYDLAMEVANDVGPSNILAKVGGGNNQAAAAGVIRQNLILDAPKFSSVIHLIFQHKDPSMVQPVLNALIQEYYKKHLAIHRDVGQFGDFLTQQTDNLHARLLQTEDALRAAKTNAGVISIEDTKKVYGEEIAHIQSEILQAEADLAERQAALSEIAKLTHTQMPVVTNDVTSSTNEVAIPGDKLAEYKRLCLLLDRLSARQQELLVQFTPENSWVKQVGEQISANEKLRDKLETEYPGLVASKPLLPKSSGSDSRSAQPDLTAEMAKVSGLQYKIKILNQQLDDIQKAAAKMYASEGSISDLQRKYYLQETQYNYFSMSLEQSRIDEALGASRVSNISQIQAPTPPGHDKLLLQKISLGILFGGIALAFAISFVIEFVFDRSIKRPIEIETKLGMQLFLSIPRLNLGKPKKSLPGGKVPLLPETAKNQTNGDHSKTATNGNSHDSDKVPAVADGVQLAGWESRSVLRPFSEALRDNLITFFEVNNLTHKPKLVAVTSCSEGAGVSTVASGLAASLSETGEGNVLLVNMNQAEGAVHQFYKGNLSCDLDDVLEGQKRDKSMVDDNLYVAHEAPNGDSLPVILPRRFKSLVPKLRASDYDYIIFDMPAVSQIAPTQRLARFMDMVLMVVESERTDSVEAKRVGSLLINTKTNVGVVLNKLRTDVPRRLQQAS